MAGRGLKPRGGTRGFRDDLRRINYGAWNSTQASPQAQPVPGA
jgi:hypothetical protein